MKISQCVTADYKPGFQLSSRCRSVNFTQLQSKPASTHYNLVELLAHLEIGALQRCNRICILTPGHQSCIAREGMLMIQPALQLQMLFSSSRLYKVYDKGLLRKWERAVYTWKMENCQLYKMKNFCPTNLKLSSDSSSVKLSQDTPYAKALTGLWVFLMGNCKELITVQCTTAGMICRLLQSSKLHTHNVFTA